MRLHHLAIAGGLSMPHSPRFYDGRLWVLDIRTGTTVAFLCFSGSVTEVFAVHVLPHCRHPELINEDHELVAGAFFIPPQATAPDPIGSSAPVGA